MQMRLTVANVSRSLAQADFDSAVAAIARQVHEDFSPEWGVSATLRSTALKLGRGHVSLNKNVDAVIYVGDEVEDPTTGVENAYGYHSTNHKGTPYGFVYLDVCAAYHEEWTSTLSHEVLELLADPTAVLIVAGPDPNGSGDSVNYDLEVCDPTQGDSYVIDSVEVSNFVTKAYFKMAGGKTKETNHLGLSLEPFGVRSGGYFQYEDGAGAHQVDGERVKAERPERDAARKKMAMGRRNNRRANRRFHKG
jgi:hypothetical protein